MTDGVFFFLLLATPTPESFKYIDKQLSHGRANPVNCHAGEVIASITQQ